MATYYGSSGNDYILGGNSNDSIYGLAGNDILHGGRGSDYLAGGDGNDILRGWQKGNGIINRDTLVGGSGSDLFELGDSSDVFYTGSGFGTVADFNRYEGDKIQLKGSLSNYTFAFGNSAGGSQLDTEIRRNGNLIAVVQDFTGLVASDFHFV